MRVIMLCQQAIAARLPNRIDDGHTLLFRPLSETGQLPADLPESDAIVLQALCPSSAIQDFLGRTVRPKPVLIFEIAPNGTVFWVSSAAFPMDLVVFLRKFFGPQFHQLRYPELDWHLRFPDAFPSAEQRETRRALLYGMTFSEFQVCRGRYGWQLGDRGYYLFVWELGKKILSDYPTNRDVHQFLHARRLEEFRQALGTSYDGEILFSDLSFAYILLNAPDSRSAAARVRIMQQAVSELSGISGRQDVFCFLSDYIPGPENVPDAFASFRRSCAYRFFCREAEVISPGYISAHRRWIDSASIAETLEQVRHLVRTDLSGPRLPICIRKLYLDMIKPSMSYMLYYIISETILICLEREQSAKMVLDSFNEPYALLQGAYSSVEESCQRVLDCIQTLSRQDSKHYSVRSEIVRQAVTSIERDFTSDFQVGGLAQQLNVSAAYLGQLFKAETGSTIKNYVAGLRLQRAKHLLLCSDEPISTVAALAGYNDFRYFSKVFKQRVGLSPSQYRQSHRGDSPLGGIEAHFSPQI